VRSERNVSPIPSTKRNLLSSPNEIPGRLPGLDAPKRVRVYLFLWVFGAGLY
jgi:hypothetical protein